MNESSYFANSWALAVVAAALVLSVAEVILRRNFHASILLRFAWISLLGFVIADWTHVHSKEFSKPELLHVFFDRSDSVLRVPERRARLEQIVAELKSWASKKSQPLHWVSFGESPQESSTIPATGSLKTFIEPLSQIDAGNESSAVLISDGLWTDYANFHIPIHSVQLGDSSEKDVWIDEVAATQTAFLKDRLKIPVRIGQRGFDGKKVNVTLSYLDDIVDEKEAVLSEKNTTVELSYFPEKMGEKIFTVSVSGLPGELSSLNNRSSIRVRTVRDKIRVLHVNGKPSPDLKAWRSFLTHQPDVDLVSFYILRTLNDNPEAKNSELSLIPFPHEELFSVELERFDLVILQNFDFSLYFQPYYLTNLASFVRRGGTLLMIGGDQGFHRYRMSPLEPLMPFEFVGAGEFSLNPLKIAKVMHHPIVDGLTFDLETPIWTGHHRLKSQADSTDLVSWEGGIPFLSFRDYEKGRVFTINSDESWKLQMQPMKEAAPFARLARRILQYLTFDSEMDVRSIVSGKWNVGKEVTLQMANSEVADWKIRPLWSQGEVMFQKMGRVTYLVPEAGLYEVESSLLAEPMVFETEEQPWRDEWKNLLSNDSKLKTIAQESHGKFYSFAERSKVLEESLSGHQMIAASYQSWTRENTALSWMILFFALTCLCLDFYFRKRIYWDS